jgi:hypothetical protein
MRKIRFVLILSATIVTAWATAWNRSVDANLTSNENAYSNNWTGGATGLFTWVINSDMLAEKQLDTSFNTRTTLKLSFGQTYKQETSKAWASPTKNSDQIDLQSVFKATLGAWVDPFISARVQSQFLDQSDTALTRYVNPLTVTEAFGAARSFMKTGKRELISRLGGGFKQDIDRLAWDTAAALRRTNTTSAGGLTFSTDFTTPIARDKLTYTSQLDVFEALFSTDAAKYKGLPSADYWRAPNVEWDNTFAASITKLLMVNLYVQILYDKVTNPKVMFQQTLALGLTYRII